MDYLPEKIWLSYFAPIFQIQIQNIFFLASGKFHQYRIVDNDVNTNRTKIAIIISFSCIFIPG